MATKNTKNKSGSKDADVERYQKIFAYAYRLSDSDFNRLRSLQKSFDNNILAQAWPTQSKIPIAAFYDMVEKSLPLACDYLFVTNNPIRLMPAEPGVTMDQVSKAEKALYHLITYKMKAQRNSLPILKDVFKCGVGFGIVEPITITPPQSFAISVDEGGQRSSTRAMRVGRPVSSLRLRYINPGQVVVVPDGSDFNGNDPVSVAFLYDIYSEAQFRSLFATDADGEKVGLEGEPEKIIEEARTRGFSSETDIEDFLSSMGGKRIKRMRPDNEYVPVHIPVLKVFERNRHVWIANGTTKVYDVEDQYQTMRCPLIKATAWMDGNRFYPMSTPEAFERVAWAKNIIINLFLDMMTLSLRRPLVYNADYFDREPSFGPDDKIRTTAADARMGAAFLESPRIDPATVTLFEIVSGVGQSLTGQKNFMDKNFTRGGSMAFQDLMATTEGTDRLHGAILEMGFLESVCNQGLIFLQTNIGKEGEVVRRRVTSRNSGSIRDEIEEVTVTEEDLVHAYELSLDLKGKARKGAIERNLSLALYQAKSQSPFFDQYEVAAAHLCESDEEIARQMKSREDVAKIQQERDDLEMRERAAKLAASGGGGAPGASGMQPEMAGQVAGQEAAL